MASTSATSNGDCTATRARPTGHANVAPLPAPAPPLAPADESNMVPPAATALHSRSSKTGAAAPQAPPRAPLPLVCGGASGGEGGGEPVRERPPPWSLLRTAGERSSCDEMGGDWTRSGGDWTRSGGDWRRSTTPAPMTWNALHSRRHVPRPAWPARLPSPSPRSPSPLPSSPSWAPPIDDVVISPECQRLASLRSSAAIWPARPHLCAAPATP